MTAGRSPPLLHSSEIVMQALFWDFTGEELQIAQYEDSKRAASHARDLTCAKDALSSDPPQPALVSELSGDASGTPGRCSVLGPAASPVERLACADPLM